MDAKTTEQEVNAIMTRFDSDWESRSKKEKKAIFAECMKEQNVVWDGFTFGQRTWIIRYLGFWKYWMTVADNGLTAGLGPFFYWGRVYPKGCLMTFGILAVVALIAGVAVIIAS